MALPLSCQARLRKSTSTLFPFSALLKAFSASDTEWLRVPNSMIVSLSLLAEAFELQTFSDQ